MIEKVVLITNLLDVSIDTGFGNVCTHTNALVLSDRGSEDGNGPRYRMYGFHNEASNPTFNLTLPSFEWTIEVQSYRRSFALRFVGDAPKILLTTDFANDLPLDIEHISRAAGHGWADMLLRKVLRYYHAPYIVLGQQLDADQARKALGIESAERIPV